MDTHPAFEWLLDSASSIPRNLWILDKSVLPLADPPSNITVVGSVGSYQAAPNGPSLALYHASIEGLAELEIFFPLKNGTLEDVPDDSVLFEVEDEEQRLPIPAVTASITFASEIPLGAALTSYSNASTWNIEVRPGWARGPAATIRDFFGLAIVTPQLVELEVRKLVRGDSAGGDVDEISLITVQAAIDTYVELHETYRADAFLERRAELFQLIYERVRNDLLYQFLLGSLDDHERQSKLNAASEITGLSTVEVEEARDRSFHKQYGD